VLTEDAPSELIGTVLNGVVGPGGYGAGY